MSSSPISTAVEKFDVLDVKVAAINLQKACLVIDELIRHNCRTYICVAPVSTIVDCQASEEYKEVINRAFLTTPDGVPLVWLGKAKGYKEIQRTYGPDLLLALCRFGQDRGYRHYFYGSTSETNARLEVKLRQRFPGINIVGRCSPPFRELTKEEDEAIIAGINEAGADILWVGLGSPKQDFWMAKHQSRLKVSVMIGVGAAFDFLSGAKRQAPRWMRQAGLEWFFRLCCEPRRLARRYLIGNSKFVYFLIRDFVRKDMVR